MFENAERVRRDHVLGRFVAEASAAGGLCVIIEPYVERTCDIVMTAYPTEVE